MSPGPVPDDILGVPERSYGRPGAAVESIAAASARCVLVDIDSAVSGR